VAHRVQTNFILFRFFAIANDYESKGVESMGMAAGTKKFENEWPLDRCEFTSERLLSLSLWT
jgi:hypothetical protein